VTTKQLAAIKELENAFKKCRSAKLAFLGMGNNLLAFDAGYIKEALSSPNSNIPSLQANDPEFDNECVTIGHHGTYKDSGGF
jgi:hypothetical protein